METRHNWTFLKDFSLQLWLRLRIILKDKLVLVSFIIVAAAFALVLNTLNLQAEERSAVPIGVLDEDETALSRNLVDQLDNTKSLYVYKGSFDELEDLLMDGYLTGIYVIPEGYAEEIKAGIKEELLDVYSAKDDKISVLLGDIIAGKLLFELCRYRGIKHYHGLEGTTLSDGQYMDYIDHIRNDGEYQFEFDITYKAAGGTTKGDEGISNALLYMQMVAGMVAMLFSFMVLMSLSPVVLEREQGIIRRRSITSQGRLAVSAGDLAAVIIMSAVLCVLVAVSTAASAAGDQGEGFAAISIGIFSISIVYLLGMGILLLLLSRVARNIMQYQLLGGAVIVLSGIMGIASAFGGLFPESIAGVLKISLNSWYVEEFTRVLW